MRIRRWRAASAASAFQCERTFFFYSVWIGGIELVYIRAQRDDVNRRYMADGGADYPYMMINIL
jgi:hypothetical protein